MSVDLQRSESGTHGVRRITRAHVAAAMEALRSTRVSDDDVHTARQELKKARATLRLLRKAVGDTVYKRENTVLRDAARPLSRVRDSRALLDTLDSLVEHLGPNARVPQLAEVRAALVRERAAARRDVLDGLAHVGVLREALHDTYERAGRWRVGDRNWSIVGAGLKRVYAKGRAAFAAAVVDRSPRKLHEWRKQVKYLWHELQVLEPLWPGPIGELADQAHRLAEYLGDDHDLSVLYTKCLELRSVFRTVADRGALMAVLDRRCAELRDKAEILGRRIYEEKPTDFVARFGRYWRDWQRKR
jgi:CHAD domain-containing protein